MTRVELLKLLSSEREIDDVLTASVDTLFGRIWHDPLLDE